MADPIDADKIAENAAGPQSAAGDGESVSRYSIADQIAADQYAKGEQAKESGVMPIRVVKIQRQGTA